MSHLDKKEIVIKVQDLNIRYNNQYILKDINFDIEKGSVVAIIGPNGAGKTMLIKALLGLINVGEKTKINIYGDGKVGYVPQRFLFDRTFPITVEEFLKLSLESSNTSKAIKNALKEVGLKKYDKRLLGNLSGGELQRVLIARAIINKPGVVFLDEPSFGIDIVGEKTFYELISHLNKVHGSTYIIVSHEIDVVYKYASQVICLNKELICHGTPKKVLTESTLEELYGEKIAFHGHNKHNGHN